MRRVLLDSVAAPKVFVSYVHESRQHKDDVLAFAGFLRTQGVDTVLDMWSADTRRDWYAWAIREMTAAAYVVVVASPTYRAVGDGGGPADQHRGVQSEATLLRDLVHGDRVKWTPKVLPVLLPGHGIEEIPRFLSPYATSRYEVAAYTVTGAEDLLRVIHRRPGHVPPPVQAPPDLPPHPMRPAVVWCAGMPDALKCGPDVVEVHLVHDEPMDTISSEDMQHALAEVAIQATTRGTQQSPDAVQLDRTGTTAWVEANGTGVAILDNGQRSAWFTPPRDLDTNEFAAFLKDRIEFLIEISLQGPTPCVPAIGAGSARIVLPPVTNQTLRSAEFATRLANDLRAKLDPESKLPGRVTNMVNGNVSGVVIQAGDIRGGVNFSPPPLRRLAPRPRWPWANRRGRRSWS